MTAPISFKIQFLLIVQTHQRSFSRSGSAIDGVNDGLTEIAMQRSLKDRQNARPRRNDEEMFFGFGVVKVFVLQELVSTTFAK